MRREEKPEEKRKPPKRNHSAMRKWAQMVLDAHRKEGEVEGGGTDFKVVADDGDADRLLGVNGGLAEGE